MANVSTPDEVWRKYMESNFLLNEVISDNQNMTWKTHFNTFGVGNLEFMLNPRGINLTSNYKTSFNIKLNKNYVTRIEAIGFDKPYLYLYDPRYDKVTPNLVNVPYEHPELGPFFLSTKVIIYLEVRYNMI